jgi:nucleotide-binding universal stress UspA family protein
VLFHIPIGVTGIGEWAFSGCSRLTSGIDLAVLGRQGAGGVRDLFFGNVAAKVAKAIPCPVLIVP